MTAFVNHTIPERWYWNTLKLEPDPETGRTIIEQFSESYAGCDWFFDVAMPRDAYLGLLAGAGASESEVMEQAASIPDGHLVVRQADQELDCRDRVNIDLGGGYHANVLLPKIAVDKAVR